VDKKPASIIRTVARILIVALSLYVAARLHVLAAEQRGVLVSVWFPAGISLAAALIWGPSAIAGTFIGSFLFRIWYLGGFPHAWIAAGMALGFTAQTWLGSYLVRRFIGSALPEDIRSITKILAIGFVIPAVSAASVNGLLCMASLEPWQSFGMLFWRSWLGTGLGITLATPLILLAWQALRRKTTGVLSVWLASAFILVLFGTISITVSDNNEKRMLERFRNDVSETAMVIQDAINHDLQVLKSLGAFFDASNEVSNEEFNSFTARQLGPLSTVITLAWHPRRPMLYGQGDHFPAEFMEPGNTWEPAPGFDIAAEPKGPDAIEKALLSRQPSVLFPVRLTDAVKLEIQAVPGESDFVVAIYPIFRDGQFQGLASAWFKPRQWMDKVFENVTRHDIEYLVFKTPMQESSALLWYYPSVTGRQKISAEEASRLLSQVPPLSEQFRLSIADADWTVLALPSPHAREYSLFSWSWINMLLGLVIVIFYLFYMDGRQKRLVEKERSEAEFRSLTENALTGVLKMKLSGEVLYANESATRMLGMESTAGLVGTDARKFIANPEPFGRGLEELKRAGQMTNFELEIRLGNGDLKILLCSAVLFEGVVNLTFADITERLKESRKLRQFSRVVEQMADTVVITDTEGSIEYVNPAFEMLTGYSREEVLAATPRVLKSGILGEEFYEALWGTIGRGDVFQAEFINRKKNGELYTETKTITPLRDADGTITNYVASGRDVTELHKAEVRLRESERSMRQAQQIAKVGSWEFDFATATLRWSDEAYRIFGRDPADFVPSLEVFYGCILEEDRALVQQKFEASVRDRSTYNAVHRIADPEGRDTGVVVHERCETFYDEAGKPVRSLGTVQDITERYRMEQDIGNRMKELTCLFEVNQILEDHGLGLDELKERIEKSIRAAMQYPELAELFVDLAASRALDQEDAGRLAEGSCTDEHCLSVEVKAGQRNCGVIKVAYRDSREFLPEERTLLDNIAHMLGLYFENREAEDALRESNDRFTYLADNIQEVFWMFDMVAGRFIYISPAYEKVWGRRLDAMRNDSMLFYEGVLPEDRHLLEEAIARSDAGERSETEYRIETPEGTQRWIWDRSLPVFDGQGKCVTTIGVCTDITELKQVQQELEALNRDLEARVVAKTEEVRRREEMYRGLFENSNDAIFIMSPEGKGIGANQRALDLVDCTLEKYLRVAQWGNIALADPSKRDEEMKKFNAVLRGEQIPLYELGILRNDGTVVETEVNLSVVRDAKGEPVLVQSVMRDITERKKGQERLRESRDRLSEANIALEKASRMKDEFLASMSHELRTPLTGILGLSEALQLQTFGSLNERQLKALKNVETSGRHLLELINDILDLSKIEAGKLELHFDTCQAADICQASLQLVRGMAQQKRQKFEFSITPANFAIRGDPRRLKQMLVNLLSNAVKFSPEGGTFGLTTEADAGAGMARFRVWDKGIGIKPEDQAKIFTPFTQLDSRLARQYSGTGLGLSLVKRMAELHGGTILVESELGQGSTFTLVLPLAKTDGGAEAGAETGGGAAAGGASASVKSAFVIEDNELDSEMLLRMLHSLDIPAIAQPLLEGGLEKAVRLKPGAILLDLNLPDGSGWDMLKELKADSRTRSIPVIIVSAESQREKGLSLGAVGYLVKPYSLAQLRAELDKVTAADGLAAPVLVMEEKARKPVILVADDNDLILETVTGFMETLGYTVMTAKNGLELIETASKVHPDIMLVDVQMPGMDGIEAIRRMRTMGDPVLATVPIISLTALAMVGDREKCMEAGANEYISKPFVLTEVAARVKALLA
jgi:PAS domain S-box-containing protein